MSIHSAPSNRARVLLVEDDAAVRRSLQLLLCSHGLDVRAYATNQRLAQDPEALRADCLVADLVIPDGDGITLLGELRAAGWKGAAILISGHLDNDWTLRARDEGYDLVLSKPIPDNALVNAVVRLIGKQAEATG